MKTKMLWSIALLWVCLSSVCFAWYTSWYWYDIKSSWTLFYLRNVLYYLCIQCAIGAMVYYSYGTRIFSVVLSYMICFIALCSLFIYHFYVASSVDPIYRMCYTIFLFIIACLGIDIALRSIAGLRGGVHVSFAIQAL